MSDGAPGWYLLAERPECYGVLFVRIGYIGLDDFGLGSVPWNGGRVAALRYPSNIFSFHGHQGLIPHSWWLFTPPLLSGLISFHKYFPCSYGDLDGVIIPPIVSWLPSCSLRWIETIFVSATEIGLAQLFLRDASPRCGRSLTCRDAASSGRPLALLPDGGAGTANETQT